jgi:hypothetical protein
MTRMNIVDRFTRDQVSRLVWGVLALACLVMFVVGLQGEQRAYNRQLDATTRRSQVYAANVVAPVVHVKDGKPVFFYRETYTKIQAEIFAPDPSVARVRVWGTDGLLLFSTDNRQRTGVIQAPNDPGVQAGAQGATYRSLVTQSFSWATTGLPGKDVQLLQTYTPLRLATQIQPAGTVQVDYFVADLRAAARGDWPAVRWVFGVLFLVFLGMTLLSLRPSRHAEPVAALPAPALPADAPTDEDVDDVGATTATVATAQAATATTEPESSLHEEFAAARESSLREELAAAREQLIQAEEAYRFLETKLKVARSELADRPVSGESVDARVAELEEALKRSQAELMLLRAAAARPAELSDAPNGDAREASRPSPAVEPAAADASDESAADRDSAVKLGELTEELDAVRRALEAAQADIRTAHQEAEAAKRSEQPPVASSNTLSDLEARVAEAERRAEEAEQTLEEVALSPEATSLRERLARTAARKKLASDDPRAQ